MAICDKINTAGQTLQSNLNARGVSCTYGKNSENKQTLKDMADLITASNLKGSNDALISISASRPYLLSGEKTDLIVKLVNGLGQPLANKSVSVSDGTSLYSGITNSLGLFTLYDVTVSADTTFTATYSNVSDSIVVEYCTIADYGVTSNKDSNYTTGSALTISTTTESTIVSSTSSNSATGRYRNDTAITGDFELIADVKINQAYSSVGLYIGVYSNDYTIFRIKSTDWFTVKIKREDGVFSVQTSNDGTTWTDGTFQQNNSTLSSVYTVLYVYNSSSSNNGLSYRNLRLKQ